MSKVLMSSRDQRLHTALAAVGPGDTVGREVTNTTRSHRVAVHRSNPHDRNLFEARDSEQNGPAHGYAWRSSIKPKLATCRVRL